MADGSTTFRKRTPRLLRQRDTIAIATEGIKTEPDYFTYLQRKYRETIIYVISRDHSRSEPMQVLDDLIEYKGQKSGLRNKAKAHWIVIDIDGRSPEVIRRVTAKAAQNDILVADSNPCFELWLLLHRKALRDYDDNVLEEFLRNEKIGNRTRLEIELVKVCGEYNKRNIRESDFLPYVTTAIMNAHDTDPRPNSPWIHQIGSRVYRLIQTIRDVSASPQNPSH